MRAVLFLKVSAESRSVAAAGFHADDAFGLAEFGPGKSVETDQDEAAKRHPKRGGHVDDVAEVAHEFRHQRPAGDGHDDERSGFLLGLRTEAVDADREDCRIHDGHEEIAEKNAQHGNPSQLADN